MEHSKGVKVQGFGLRVNMGRFDMTPGQSSARVNGLGLGGSSILGELSVNRIGIIVNQNGSRFPILLRFSRHPNTSHTRAGKSRY